MNRYNYEIFGDYEEWAKIVVDNQLIHYGSVIGIIRKESTNTVMSLKHDTKTIYTYILRKKNEYIVGIPLVIKNNNVQKYYPLVFTEEEYDEFLQKCYIDESIAYNLQECKNEELIQMWACAYNASIFNHNTSESGIKNLYNNIVFISNNISVADLEICFNNSYLKLEELSRTKKAETITVYVDLGSVEEWHCLVEIDDELYLKLTDTLVIRMDQCQLRGQ